jgi:hypothetical protein
MKQDKVKKHIKNIIYNHYEQELWGCRPDFTYEGAIEEFVDSIANLIERVSQDRKPEKIRVYPSMPIEETCSDIELAIGRNLKLQRKAKGKSLAYMAKATMFDIDYYKNMENGSQWLRVWEIFRAAEELDIELVTLLPH